MDLIRVMIWNEFVHERQNSQVAALYPHGLHETIAASLRSHAELRVGTAVLAQPEHGLTEAVLTDTDVLLWWGHAAHDQVADDIVERVHRRVIEGMGLIVLHSGHASKIFRRLMGSSCMLCWREAGERERVWVVNPGHPIAEGIGDCIELEQSEMYGEPFGIPAPDEQVFISWFQGGEVFRGGNCWTRGSGRIFYFSPGHETYPIYHHPDVQRVIYNAVRWARPQGRVAEVPVLMLTARGEESDRIVGSELGADDYLPKTFSTRELLARLQMAIGILEQRADPANRGVVADAVDEVKEMAGLVNELLSFSKAGLRPQDVLCEPVQLAALAHRVIERENGASRVRVDISEGLSAMAEPELLSRALANLVRNAIRYAGDSGPIVVSADRQGDEVCLRVGDSGSGVPEAALSRIFDPFYRVEASRSRETGGAGLGLAIVKTCVEACRGRVVARNRSPSGLEVTLHLPVAG